MVIACDLAGVDTAGAHVHTIHNPGGTERLHDPIGYAAVGSGTPHAIQALIGFQHSAEAEYPETVFRVYAAKRRAEVAPGVGLETDLAVISAAGIRWLAAEELDQLGSMFDDFQAPAHAELVSKLQTLNLGDEQADKGGDRIDGGGESRTAEGT